MLAHWCKIFPSRSASASSVLLHMQPFRERQNQSQDLSVRLHRASRCLRVGSCRQTNGYRMGGERVERSTNMSKYIYIYFSPRCRELGEPIFYGGGFFWGFFFWVFFFFFFFFLVFFPGGFFLLLRTLIHKTLRARYEVLK